MSHKKTQALLTNFRSQGTWFQLLCIFTVGIFIGLVTLAITKFPTRWIILLVLVAIFTFAALMTGKVRRFLLAVILLDIPFSWDIHFSYNEEAGAMGALGGWNISITTIALIVLYIMWFLDWLKNQKNSPRFPILSSSLPLVMYLGFTVLSIIVAKDLQLSAFQLFLLAQQFALFVYIIGTVRSRSDIIFIITVLAVGLVLESIIIISLKYIGHTIEFTGIKARIDEGGRIGGTVGGPNTAGAYLSMVLIPSFSLLIAQVNRALKWLGTIAFGLGLIAIVLTLSRGGWVAFLLSSLIFFFICWFRGWLPLKVPVIFAGTAISLFIFGHEMIATRIFGYDNGAAASRIPLMKLAFNIIRKNPFLGVGANNFTFVMQDYISTHLSGLWLYAVHNKYLSIWAETGIGGLLAFLYFLLTTLRKGWTCWQNQDPLLAPIGLGLLAAIIGHIAHMNLDTFQNRSMIQLLWVSSALIIAIYNRIQYEKKQQLITESLVK